MQSPVPASADTVVTVAGTKLHTLAEAAQVRRCSTDTIMRRVAASQVAGGTSETGSTAAAETTDG